MDSVRRTCREHDRLIEFLTTDNSGNAAGKLMKTHIRAGRQLALASFDRTYINSPLHAARPGRAAREDAFQDTDDTLKGDRL
jgi:hypothetical protein